MTARLRPVLADLPAYTPGKTVPDAIKLASNETVHPPLPGVRAAIERATDLLNRYPDNGYRALRERLADHLGAHRVTPEQIAAGAGSVSLCQQLIQITAGPGDEVLFAWRSFEVYPLQVRLAGATPVPVPLRADTHDLDAMAAAVTADTRLIFVCNPNNPTSTVVDPGALERFVAGVRDDIVIAVDEAYIEYVRDGLAPDTIGLIARHPNVVVLRTFSKAYGLAGARVGYAVGHPDLITALDKAYVPFTLGSLAQAAAIASLDAADELLARTDAVVAERRRVTVALRDAGYRLPDPQANFVWLPLGEAHPNPAAAAPEDPADRTGRFVRECAEQARVVVRPYGSDGVRVTIGAPAENDAFLDFARSWS